MFIIELTYTKPLDVIDLYLQEHRAYIEKCCNANYIIAAGPKIPREGGILISGLKDRAQLEAILKNDPYKLNGVAEYKITEFTPVKFNKDFAPFINA